jgi:predicted lipid-binding transport protein (Tim44 family)
MNKLAAAFLAMFSVVALLLSSPEDAYAKRLGGGRSFGSRPSYSEPYRAPTGAGPMIRNPQPGYQSSAQRNQTMRDSFRSRGGLMGMLGGLALGGLLGALFFGGAFEHLNFLDLLAFGLVAFLLFRFLAARRRSQWEPAHASATRNGYSDSSGSARTGAERGMGQRPTGSRFETDVLFRQKQGPVYGSDRSATEKASAVPAGFDPKAFLVGAKNAYRHLQAAWDSADLAELRALTTDEIFAELQDQLQQRSGLNRTQVLTLDAELLDVREEGTQQQASVLFEASLRESDDETTPKQIREVWHFTRDRNNGRPTWFLDGIQQWQL